MLRHVCLLTVLVGALSTSAVFATDLRITDSRGIVVVVAGALIDYSGFLTDKETDGIRVLQGDGIVRMKWIDVESLRVTGRDESVKPPRIELEVVLRSGRKVAAALFRQGQMKLQGKSDLGEYAIDLEKIRAISPIE